MDVVELLSLLDSLNLPNVSKEDFDTTAEYAKGLKNLSNDERLQLYGLFKQSTVGDVNTSRPWSINAVEAAKWDSWKKYEGWPKEKAQTAYVYIVRTGFSKSGSEKSDGFVASVSTLKNVGDDSNWDDESEKIFKFTTSNATTDLMNHLKLHPSDVNKANTEGLTPLHYAADRGFLKTTDLLLNNGANINATDPEGNTPAVLAAMCNNSVILQYLIARGADLHIPNNDGLTIFDLDNTPEINEILQTERTRS